MLTGLTKQQKKRVSRMNTMQTAQFYHYTNSYFSMANSSQLLLCIKEQQISLGREKFLNLPIV
jgi:hypothetical protein